MSQIQVPKLSNVEQEKLNAPFTTQEVTYAMSTFNSNNLPGEVGFPPEFYKKFKDLLLSPFMEVIKKAAPMKSLPDSFLMAIITVIPNKDRYLLKPPSYRPISLLNTDYKIVAKILENKLTGFLQNLIHMDQTRFVKKRTSADNIPRLISVIHLAQKKGYLSITVALDAEKAFDRFDWDFLFNVLEKYGVGLTHIDWIRALYKKPEARVVTNG